VVDTLGNAYLQQSVITSASAAETAAARKRNKYRSLGSIHDFFPVALETLGPISVSSPEFLAQNNRKAFDHGDDRSAKNHVLVSAFVGRCPTLQRGLSG